MSKMTKVCGCCETSKNLTQYYKSPIDGSFLPLCKNCCRKKMREYEQIVGNQTAALWLVLSELGIPFIYKIWESIEPAVVVASVNTDIVMLYLKALIESGLIVHGFWDSDTMLDQLIESSVNREEKSEDLDLEEQQKIWGRFLTEKGELDIEAYNYLNQTFDDYTQDLPEMDTNLERRYRDVAKAELRKRRADESGDIQEITKAQDSLKKILDMLKLSDFQKQETDERKKFIDRMSWIIEETEPSEEEDLNKYRDIAGFEQSFNEIMRSMQNMIAHTREYPDVPKEEM